MAGAGYDADSPRIERPAPCWRILADRGRERDEKIVKVYVKR
jgi:hypothetical protein